MVLLAGRKYPDFFFAWAEGEPQHLAIFRRVVSVASSWVYERSYKRMLVFPWALALITDPRQAEATIVRTIKSFDDAPPELLDECFCSRLKKMLEDRGLGGSALRSGIWFRSLQTWTWLVVGTVEPVEFLHSRNRRRASGCEHWAHFVAKGLLAESSRFLASCMKAFGSKKPRKREAASTSRHKRQRVLGVRDLFNRDFNAARKRIGLPTRIDNPAYWRANRDASQSLSAEEVAHYKHQQALARQRLMELGANYRYE